MWHLWHCSFPCRTLRHFTFTFTNLQHWQITPNELSHHNESVSIFCAKQCWTTLWPHNLWINTSFWYLQPTVALWWVQIGPWSFCTLSKPMIFPGRSFTIVEPPPSSGNGDERSGGWWTGWAVFISTPGFITVVERFCSWVGLVDVWLFCWEQYLTSYL